MRLLFATLLLLCLFSCQNEKSQNSEISLSTDNISQVIWPTDEWQHQSYSVARVNVELLQSIEDSIPEKHSLLIVKDGYIVYESYDEPYAKDSLIHINSCTKSVIAMLFGMVFKDQLAENENRAAIDYFPEYQINDSAIAKIKVKHFLSMSSGLQWKGGIDAADVISMARTDDWANYVFQREAERRPGDEFLYNSGGTQVVSSLLHKAVPTGLASYAKDSLFQPLGITEFKWDKTSRGILKAGWGLNLKMPDMAKLGYLMLNKGKWNEEQLIPEEWVDKATKKQIVANSVYDYGYQFWISKKIDTENYFFRGSYPPSTKTITILPELNAVVVYVGESGKVNEMLRDFIIPALRHSDRSSQ